MEWAGVGVRGLKGRVDEQRMISHENGDLGEHMDVEEGGTVRESFTPSP